MFTFKFLNLGTVSDLLKWSQAGRRCDVCIYISLRFIMDIEEETAGDIPLGANVIIRWATRDTAIKDGRRDEVPSCEFEISWGLLQGKTRQYSLNCFTTEGKLNPDKVM